MKKKTTYRLRNWTEYNKALKQRGSLTVWISDDARRLPLAALGMIDFGAVRATMKAFSRPGEPGNRAENKANIKW